MITMYGDLWKSWGVADLFLIEGHATLDQYGMYSTGSPSARQAKARYPSLPDAIASMIKSECEVTATGRNMAQMYSPYYLKVSDGWPERKMGFIQVREGPRTSPNVNVLKPSVEQLIAWCAEHPEAQVHMPYVAYGTSFSFVPPLLDTLPDTVTCWLPSNHKPKPLSIPEGHEYYPAMSLLDGDFIANGFRLKGQQYETALYRLYSSLHTTRNGRLNQHLTIMSYIENGNDIQGAYETGRNKFNSLARMFPPRGGG